MSEPQPHPLFLKDWAYTKKKNPGPIPQKDVLDPPLYVSQTLSKMKGNHKACHTFYSYFVLTLSYECSLCIGIKKPNILVLDFAVFRIVLDVEWYCIIYMYIVGFFMYIYVCRCSNPFMTDSNPCLMAKRYTTQNARGW